MFKRDCMAYQNIGRSFPVYGCFYLYIDPGAENVTGKNTFSDFTVSQGKSSVKGLQNSAESICCTRPTPSRKRPMP